MKRILLVEDTKSLAENMADILSILGFDVLIASNGQEAWDRLAIYKPDLVITDVLMPVMNGLELTANIRSNAKLKDLPVIMLSARATPEDVEKGFEAGASDYLKKPCVVEEMIQSINKFIDS